MVAVGLRPLIDRLGDVPRRALEEGAALTLTRTHYNVELEHWLLKLIDSPGGELASLLRNHGADVGRLAADLNRALDTHRTGNAKPPALGPDLVVWMQQAWLLASVEYSADRVRAFHLLLALISDEMLARRARDLSRQLALLSADALARDSAAVAASDGAMAADGAVPGPAAKPSGGPLDLYTTDLTAQARAGMIDPILGRDAEIRQVIDILTRRRQNNPILTGEAGVGKTAVVEGFAQRIAAGDVPPALLRAVVRTLDLGLLQAGAGVRGEFENRLKSVVDAVKASPLPVVLFIDEAHTLVGAGGAAGQGDAANLLKPALARGELRCIAATTWAEYKKYFEKDAALARRFQPVKVEEPDEATATAMVRGLVATLERHHGVRVLDEALGAAVRLSTRYIAGRQLPDKAVSLIDTACARVRMSQTSDPPTVQDCRRRILLADAELALLAREEGAGADHAARRASLAATRDDAAARLAELTVRHGRERDLVAAVARAWTETDADPAGAAGGRVRLGDLQRELAAVQGEAPLVFPAVDAQAVAGVVEDWTGVPARQMRSDDVHGVLGLRAALALRVIGQDHALEAVAQAIRVSRAGLTDPRKPVGVFLMVGPSGVGKTETALGLAEALYGGEQTMTVVNMTEYKEEHKVSLLMGSPPGYVGYGEGGVLTEAVRRRPYSVVLLDEVEKAHPGVQDVFYQVFDKGTLKDGEGRDIDFRNTVIIMTANTGSDLIARLCADPDTVPDAAALAEALRPALLQTFKPAFLGRVQVVPYLPLSDDTLRRVAALQLDRIGRRLWDSHRATFRYDPSVVETIAARCTETASGARAIESILSRGLLPELSAELLARLGDGQTVSGVTVEAEDGDSFRYVVT